MNGWLHRFTGGDGPKIIANAGWLYADQILRAVVGLVVFSLVTRSLGPSGFGVLSYAIAFPAIFLPFAGLGLDHVIIRDFVRHPGQREAVFSTAFTIKAVAGVVACASSLLAIRLVPSDVPARSLLVITSLSLLLQPLLTLDYYFQSQVAAKYSALARMSTCLMGNGLRAWFALRGAPVAWFAGAFVAETALYGASLVIAARATGLPWIHPWRCFDRLIMQRLLGAAWPVLLADIAISGYLKFDQILLSYLAGPAVLGRYAAAFRLADYAEFFALALINSYFPKIVAIQQQRPQELRASINRFFIGMTWFAIALAVVVSAAAPVAATLVLGPKFGEVWPVLVILAWANVFVTQVAVRGKWFLIEELQLYSMMFFMVGAVLHLSLLVCFAPRWGALGAAASFCAAQACMALVAPAFFTRSRSAAGLALRSFKPQRI
jgi:O-antigen/teichoic acid export membrane protein